jgi:TPR repeat protein
MKKLIIGAVFLLNSCTLFEAQPLSNLELAKTYIFDLNNPILGKKQLDLAVQKENSIEARNLLARMFMKSNWKDRIKAEYLVAPYIDINRDSALIYGLIHYPDNDEESFKGFLKSAKMGHPTGMIYTAGHFHHILRENESAIEWAFKAIKNGCGNGGSYVYLMDIDTLDKQDLNRSFYSISAEYDNAFAQTVMAEEAKLIGLIDEELYWRKRAKLTFEEYRIKDSLSVFDLDKDCRQDFGHDSLDH